MNNENKPQPVFTLPFTLEKVILSPNTILVASVLYTEKLREFINPKHAIVGYNPDSAYVDVVVAMGSVTDSNFKVKVGDFVCLRDSCVVLPMLKDNEVYSKNYFKLCDNYNVMIAFDGSALAFGEDYELNTKVLPYAV